MPKTKKNSLQSAMVKAQQAPVEYIAFSGGGAKGAIYSGVYDALSEGGIMKNVKAVAGASAGAITAAFVATGITPENFEKLSKNTNLKGLLGKKGAMMMNKDGTPLYELVKQTVQSNIADYLNDNDIVEVCKERAKNLELEQKQIVDKLEPYLTSQDEITGDINSLKKKIRSHKGNADTKELLEQRVALLEKQSIEIENNIKALIQQENELQKQAEKIQKMINDGGVELEELKQRANNGGKICFKDLALLNLVEPERFKGLVMTAVRRDNGELTIFSPEKTPNVEIALAARASASIPIVFEPVTIDGVQYVDGGYRDNTPTSHFNNTEPELEDLTDSPEKTKKAREEGRTLAFAFGSNDPSDPLQVAVYSSKEKISTPNMVVRFLMDVVFKMLASVGGDFKYTASEEEKYQRIRANALNAVMVDPTGVSTLSFDEAQKKADYLHVKGYLQTMGHMHNHELGEHYDHNLEHKQFMLEVYEKIDANAASTWSSKVKAGREIKAEVLLDFCKADKWKQNQKEVIIERFIVAAAVSFKDGKLTESTTAMNKLIESLNKTTTPDIVKLDFAKALGMNTKNLNLAQLTFKKEDFKVMLENNKDKINLDKGPKR